MRGSCSNCGDGGTGEEAWWGGKEKGGAFRSAAVRGMSPEPPVRATGTPSVLPKPDVCARHGYVWHTIDGYAGE